MCAALRVMCDAEVYPEQWPKQRQRIWSALYQLVIDAAAPPPPAPTTLDPQNTLEGTTAEAAKSSLRAARGDYSAGAPSGGVQQAPSERLTHVAGQLAVVLLARTIHGPAEVCSCMDLLLTAHYAHMHTPH